MGGDDWCMIEIETEPHVFLLLFLLKLKKEKERNQTRVLNLFRVFKEPDPTREPQHNFCAAAALKSIKNAEFNSGGINTDYDLRWRRRSQPHHSLLPLRDMRAFFLLRSC